MGGPMRYVNFENIALGGGTSALLKMGKNNCCSSQQFINFVLPLWMVKSQTSGHTNVIISPFSPEFVNSNSFNSAYIMKYTHTVQCVWLCWILPRLLGEQFISLDFKKCLCLLSFFPFSSYSSFSLYHFSHFHLIFCYPVFSLKIFQY